MNIYHRSLAQWAVPKFTNTAPLEAANVWLRLVYTYDFCRALSCKGNEASVNHLAISARFCRSF